LSIERMKRRAFHLRLLIDQSKNKKENICTLMQTELSFLIHNHNAHFFDSKREILIDPEGSIIIKHHGDKVG